LSGTGRQTNECGTGDSAAPASVVMRRNIRPQPFPALPGHLRCSSPQPSHALHRAQQDVRRDRRNGVIYSHSCALLVWANGTNAKRRPPEGERRFATSFRSLDDHVGRAYLMILVTRPAPTVRPPSRIAKRRPSSMATGWISFTEMSVLSPGMTISVPSGSVTTPVTSVVRK
jgi:hypothetical protein